MQTSIETSRVRTAVIVTLSAVLCMLYMALPKNTTLAAPIAGSSAKHEVIYSFSSGIPTEKDRAAKAASVAAANQQANRVRATTDSLEGVFKLNREKAGQFARWIHEAEEATGVPPELMAALIATESSFRYTAQSWVGAVGPTQVRPQFWQDFCGGDLLDPRNNVICGAKVLMHYRGSCPDWSCAFKKYNVGPTGYHQESFLPAMERYIAKIRFHLSQLGENGSRYRWVALR